MPPVTVLVPSGTPVGAMLFSNVGRQKPVRYSPKVTYSAGREGEAKIAVVDGPGALLASAILRPLM